MKKLKVKCPDRGRPILEIVRDEITTEEAEAIAAETTCSCGHVWPEITYTIETIGAE